MKGKDVPKKVVTYTEDKAAARVRRKQATQDAKEYRTRTRAGENSLDVIKDINKKNRERGNGLG